MTSSKSPSASAAWRKALDDRPPGLGSSSAASLAAHPGGTVKVGELLDSDLKTKQYDNLYVCDCSVIPKPWGLPPTYTILALGKRLGKYLAGS